jgi:hypothetical protein
MTKTTIALAFALVAGSASLAAAQDADPNLLNRYPVYNSAVTVQQPQGFVSSQVALRNNGHLRSSQVRLQNQNTYGAPVTHGAGRAPGAFYQQEQSGFPQSPPTGS